MVGGGARSYPVEDQDFPNVELLLKQSRGDRDRVEEAETHGLIGLGVVARRPYDGETVLDVTDGGFKGQIDDAADSHPGGWRGIQFVPRGIGIDAHSAAGQPHEALDGQLRQLRHVQLLTIHRVRSCAKRRRRVIIRVALFVALLSLSLGEGERERNTRLTKEKSMSFAVTRLYLLEGGLARAYSVAALQQPGLREPRPHALQPASVLRMAAHRFAADAGVLQHERIVGQAGGGGPMGGRSAAKQVAGGLTSLDTWVAR